MHFYDNDMLSFFSSFDSKTTKPKKISELSKSVDGLDYS